MMGREMRFLAVLLLALMLLGIAGTATAQTTGDDDDDSSDAEPMDALFAGACCTLLILPLIIWIFICVWVYRDANSRGMNAILWLIIVLFIGIIGLIIYLVVRRDHPKGGYMQGPPPGYGGPGPGYGNQGNYPPPPGYGGNP